MIILDQEPQACNYHQRVYDTSQWADLTDIKARITQISRKPKDQIRFDRLEEMWEKIDQEIGIIFHEAEKALKIPTKKSHKWSPALATAGLVKRFWKLCLNQAHAGCHNPKLHTQAVKLRIHNDGTEDIPTLQTRYEDIPTLQTRYDVATCHFSSMINRDIQLREDHLSQLKVQALLPSNSEAKEELKPLQAIQQTESLQKVFWRVRTALKPLCGGTISWVEIPEDLADPLASNGIDQESPVLPADAHITSILQQIVQNKRSATEEWETIINQPTLERAILLFCSQHFQQASNTPFGAGQLVSLLGTSGLTSAGKEILSGTWLHKHPELQPPELRSFIAHLARPAPLRNVPGILTEISVKHYQEAIKKWSKKTTTSPSGRHLGFYKVLQELPSIQQDMCHMLNIVI